MKRRIIIGVAAVVATRRLYSWGIDRLIIAFGLASLRDPELLDYIVNHYDPEGELSL